MSRETVNLGRPELTHINECFMAAEMEGGGRRGETTVKTVVKGLDKCCLP